MPSVKTQQGPATLNVRGMAGIRRRYPIVSRDAQSAVKALLDRLAFLRQNGDEDLLTMDEVLHQLQVPEDRRGECAEVVADYLQGCDPTSANYQKQPIPRDLFRELESTVYGSYDGSWLERELMRRHTFFGEGHGLRYLEHMAKRLGDSCTKARDRICPQEAGHLLLKLAEGIAEAAAFYEPDEKPEESEPEPEPEPEPEELVAI